MMRASVKRVETMDDISDQPESDSQQIGPVIIGRKEYAPLSGKAGKMDKKGVYYESGTWLELPRISVQCSFC